MNIRANGKLLLSGEYLVLHGAVALALPTTFGQELHVSETSENRLIWRTFINRELIFEAAFDLSGEVQKTNNQSMSARLSEILKVIRDMKQVDQLPATDFKAQLDFPLNWGLGSSSTLIYNLSKWADINPFDLLSKTFSGSGYDVACAGSDSAILYHLDENKPKWTDIKFDPPFSHKLFFIHLNQKMNSRDSVKEYLKKAGQFDQRIIDEISGISRKLAVSVDLKEFEILLEQHELILGGVLDQLPVKTRLFPDYPGTLKSLGAWGGDFILAVGDEDDMHYFRKRGYQTILPFHKMILI